VAKGTVSPKGDLGIAVRRAEPSPVRRLADAIASLLRRTS